MWVYMWKIFSPGTKTYWIYVKLWIIYSCSSPSSPNIAPIFGFITDYKHRQIQRIQNLFAGFITGTVDYIHPRGMDIVHSLNSHTIKERWDYFLCALLFKCISGLASNYLCYDIHKTMNVNIHGYDTRFNKDMDLRAPFLKDNYKRRLSYMAKNLWNAYVKESANLDSFNQNSKYVKGWIDNVGYHRKHFISDITIMVKSISGDVPINEFGLPLIKNEQDGEVNFQIFLRFALIHDIFTPVWGGFY